MNTTEQTQFKENISSCNQRDLHLNFHPLIINENQNLSINNTLSEEETTKAMIIRINNKFTYKNIKINQINLK